MANQRCSGDAAGRRVDLSRCPGRWAGRSVLRVPMLLTLALALGQPAATQQRTEVMAMDLSIHEDHVHIGSLTRLGDEGATSGHPHFLDHDRVLFLTADDEGGDQLREFTLSTRQVRLLSERAEDLRHPRVDPSGRHIALIQSDAAGSPHLVLYPVDGGVPLPVIPELGDIVGFAWADDDRLVVVRGDHPRSLDLVDLRTGDVRRLRDQIGPVVASIPGSADVSFVDESDPGLPTLRRWRLDRDEDEVVAVLPSTEGVHAWFSPFTVFLLHRGILFRSTGDPDRPWHPMLTELDELVGKASAFAVSPAGLRIAVVVGDEGP